MTQGEPYRDPKHSKILASKYVLLAELYVYPDIRRMPPYSDGQTIKPDRCSATKRWLWPTLAQCSRLSWLGFRWSAKCLTCRSVSWSGRAAVLMGEDVVEVTVVELLCRKLSGTCAQYTIYRKSRCNSICAILTSLRGHR